MKQISGLVDRWMNGLLAPRLRLPCWVHWRSLFTRFTKFCLVGGSGVVVDMAVLHLLASPKWCGLNVTLAKFCSAEAALLNNFLWNELWTFRGLGTGGGRWRRLAGFHAICGSGIVLAVLLLHLFYSALRLNLYLANFLAILLVTLWNFGMNARFNWRGSTRHAQDPPK